MKSCKNSLSLRIIILFLVALLTVAANAYAAEYEIVEPKASYYLDAYNAYIYPAALGKIHVYFDVTGVDYMDEIGTLNIQVYESTDNENWTRVKAYTHDTSSGMLGYDKIYHSGHVTYSGTIGRYYKAYVCVWAGKDGSGDTRYFWTHSKKATLFAS